MDSDTITELHRLNEVGRCADNTACARLTGLCFQRSRASESSMSNVLSGDQRCRCNCSDICQQGSNYRNSVSAPSDPDAR